MASELQRERESSTLSIEEVTNMLDGGRHKTERRRRLYKLMQDDPALSTNDSSALSNEAVFTRCVEQSVYLTKKCNELDITEEERRLILNESSFAVHSLMFIPTIEGQGTEEQQKRWLPLANSHQILGTYVQSEMGHGTNVRGLETVATYDLTTQEFVLNTPTLTATKWWPGTLGHIATHAVVLARLVTLGRDHGIHPFIVQIRSLEDHTPLPGIKVGDIGPKFGFANADNGFLQLRDVRIPRDHMLMKYAQVAPDGVYTKPLVEKIVYGTMIHVRTRIVTYAAIGLSKAVTIAVRYSVVRRQGQETTGGPETQVLDYQTQQYKLLPLLSVAYALNMAGVYMFRLFLSCRSEMAKGSFQSLSELHATSAGLKAFSSELSSQGMEVCRLACGGHGYLQASGIPFLYVTHVAAMTYEGENTVMYLQTARYLNKVYLQKQPSASLPANVAYLGADYTHHKHYGVRSPSQFSDPHTQLEAYRQRARRMVALAASRYDRALARGLEPVEAWNVSTVDWTVAAKAHCHYVILKAYQDALDSSQLSPPTRHVLRNLCAMFVVSGIVNSPGDFAVDNYMSPDQLRMAQEHLYALLLDLRREAVPLVDAFDIPDAVLNSALGRYDGDVYKHLFEWALKAPRNKEKVHDIYRKYLKPLMESTKSKL